MISSTISSSTKAGICEPYTEVFALLWSDFVHSRRPGSQPGTLSLLKRLLLHRGWSGNTCKMLRGGGDGSQGKVLARHKELSSGPQPSGRRQVQQLRVMRVEVEWERLADRPLEQGSLVVSYSSSKWPCLTSGQVGSVGCQT